MGGSCEVINISDISFFENIKHLVPHYYLKTIYLKLVALLRFGSGFETITKQGLHSVVEKLLPKRTAFTLAEVLIVLGIIGLIADMTIPTLHQSVTEKVTATKLKKAYSTISNAYNMAVIDNGSLDSWGLTVSNSPTDAVKATNILSPYLNILKKCDNAKGCFPNVMYKNLNNANYRVVDEYSIGSKLQLTDGSSVFFYYNAPNLAFWIDINGFDSPNQWGKDLFMFWISNEKITPASMSAMGEENPAYSQCSRAGNGWGCAAWVIYNGNMDYLHCDDLSWSGKTSCK